MFFGKFQGDKRLDAQRDGLTATIDLLESLERRVGTADAVRLAYGEVWDAAGGMPPDIPPGLVACRQLADLLVQRMARAKRELVKFDEGLAALTARTEFLDRQWNTFVALQMARKLILDGSAPGIAPTLHPSVETCQRAMIAVAGDLSRELGKHIDELFDIRAGFQGTWPALLNLEKMRIGMFDADDALEIYAGRIRDGQGELPQASTLTLMEIISMLENTVSMIEEQRIQLAVNMTMREAMRNSGLR